MIKISQHDFLFISFLYRIKSYLKHVYFKSRSRVITRFFDIHTNTKLKITPKIFKTHPKFYRKKKIHTKNVILHILLISISGNDTRIKWRIKWMWGEFLCLFFFNIFTQILDKNIEKVESVSVCYIYLNVFLVYLFNIQYLLKKRRLYERYLFHMYMYVNWLKKKLTHARTDQYL